MVLKRGACRLVLGLVGAAVSLAGVTAGFRVCARTESALRATGIVSYDRRLDLPSPIPGVVAMIEAQKSVEVTKERARAWRNEELKRVSDRMYQGDRREATRLFLAYADERRGTAEAAEALYEVVLGLVSIQGRHNRDVIGAFDLTLAGKTALRLAEENPTSLLTPRTLNICVRESLHARRRTEEVDEIENGKAVRRTIPSPDRVEPSSEDWERIFKAAAILAGRYPADPRGPECLLELADALAESPEAEAAAIDIYRLLTEWPDAWYSRFRAYRGLHDCAARRRDWQEAEAVARKAAEACAGEVFMCFDRFPEPQIAPAEPGTPWRRVMKEEVPSDGAVLLTRPKWRKGDRFFLRARSTYYDKREKRWQEPGRAEAHTVYMFEPGPEGLYAALLAHDEEFLDVGLTADPRPEIAFLGDPRRACPWVASPLFLPRFPVREGEEVVPFEGVGLVRQEGRVEEGRVVVSIQVAGIEWQQTWSPGESWWDRMRAERKTSTSGAHPFMGYPSEYRIDPWDYTVKRRLMFERAEIPAKAHERTTREVEKEALERVNAWGASTATREMVLARLPKLFSGEKLGELEYKWALEPRSSDSWLEAQCEGLATARSLLAKGEAARALEFLPYRYDLPELHDEALELRAEALLSAGEWEEATDFFRWLPRRGPLASARMRLLESEAWERTGEPMVALRAALELLRDFPDAREAVEAKSIVERLKIHRATLREQEEEDPYDAFSLRLLWRPPRDARDLCDVGACRSKGRTDLLISAGDHWRWMITSGGEEVEVPQALVLAGPLRRVSSWWEGTGTRRAEIGRRGQVTFFREADRILALGESSNEAWRHRIATEYSGLPLLVDPQLVRCPEGDRIVCGIGHRRADIGMGIRYKPMAGGLLCIDLQGQRIYEIGTDYCEGLMVFPRKGRAPVVVSLSLRIAFASPRWPREQTRTFTAFDASTGGELWSASLTSTGTEGFALGQRARGKPIIVGLFKVAQRRLPKNKVEEERLLLALDALTGEKLWERKMAREGKDWSRAKLACATGQDGGRIFVSIDRLHIFTMEGKDIGDPGTGRPLLAADFDSDGEDEVVVGDWDRFEGYTKLTILDLNGRTLWESPEGKWKVCGAEDLDGDGWLELLATREEPYHAVCVFGRFPEE